MPPLPPNLAKHTVLRTTPSWEQRHFARKDNVTRFITHRFPNKPRDDTGLANPPLPPGASRLAFHKGSRCIPRDIFPRLEWINVFSQAFPDTNPDAREIALSIPSTTTLTDAFFVAGFGKNAIDSGQTEGKVRTFNYNEQTQRFSSTINDLTYTDSNPSRNLYSGGSAVAAGSDGSGNNVLLVGSPIGELTGTDNRENQGFAQAYNLSTNTWSSIGAEMYHVPLTASVFYASSTAMTAYDVDNSRWFATAGVPGYSSNAGTLYVTQHAANGEWQANIGDENSNFFTGVPQSNFGAATAISDVIPGTPNKLRVVVGAPGTGSTIGSIRIIEGEETGSPWTWTFNADKSETTSTLGTSVAMSSDGTIVVAGDPTNGRVYVYYDNGDGTTWPALGPVNGIASSSSGTRFGQSVSIDRTASSSSLDGITIAVGEPGFSAPGRPNCGCIKVLEYAGGTWRRVMNRIDGSEGENLGENVALSSTQPLWLTAAGNTANGRIVAYAASCLS